MHRDGTDARTAAKVAVALVLIPAVLWGILFISAVSFWGIVIGLLVIVGGCAGAFVAYTALDSLGQLLDDGEQIKRKLDELTRDEENTGKKKTEQRPPQLPNKWKCSSCGCENNAQDLMCVECGRSKY